MARNDGLRDYQQEMKLRLFEEWELHRSVMVQMPTGTGKTHLLAAVVKEFLCGGGVGMRVWIVAHRRELVEQIEETVARYGMGKEPDKSAKNGRTGKDSMPEESGRVRVFSIQWLSRNRKIMDGQPDLIVIDEAHHALAETYRELWKRYPEARKLGMTATPCRLNRKGFTDLFDTLITSWSIAEFIGRGWLSSFDYVSIRANSREQRLVDSLKKRGVDGDYQVKEMNAVLNRETGIRQLYESVRRYAAGKKGIVYAVSIAHARQIAAYYSLHGVESVAIDSRTPALERKELVEDFRRGKISVLVNVDIFSEGFDCPDVEFVQLARPTLSLAKYLQQVGRGLRKSDNKESCVLIDNVGLHRIFGLPVPSLVDEWEHAGTDTDASEAAANLAAPGAKQAVVEDRRGLTVLVRNAMFRRVQLMDLDKPDELGALDKDWGYGVHEWEDTLDDYYDEHEYVNIDAKARSGELFILDESKENSEHAWKVRQIIDDSDGDHDWAITGTVDLDTTQSSGEVVFFDYSVSN